MGMLVSLTLAVFLAGSAASTADSLWRLYEQRDFFSLHDELPAGRTSEPARIAFVRAATEAAFGRYDNSSRILRGLLQSDGLDQFLERRIRERLMLNERAMFRYRAAFAAIAGLKSNDRLKNSMVLLRALQDVSPQSPHLPGRQISLRLDRFGTIIAKVNNASVRMTVDTGANLSALSRSAAHDAGLHISPIGYQVRSATNRTIRADLAVGDLRLQDGVRISNVLFLVLPDSILRVSPARGISGLIGLPVLSQLGPLRFGGDHTLVLNGQASAASTSSITLIEGDPVVRARSGDEQIFCRLDTGSNRTAFYGGVRRPAARFDVLGRRIELRPIFLPGSAANQPYVSCNLGRDSLRQLAPFTLDLRNFQMALD
jgi:predicted aspartyl protease